MYFGKPAINRTRNEDVRSKEKFITYKRNQKQTNQSSWVVWSEKMNEKIQYNEKEIPTKIRPVVNSRICCMNLV